MGRSELERCEYEKMSESSDKPKGVITYQHTYSSLLKKIELLQKESVVLKDFVSNMFELNNGNWSLSDIDRALHYWEQAFETAGITDAIDRGEPDEIDNLWVELNLDEWSEKKVGELIEKSSSHEGETAGERS